MVHKVIGWLAGYVTIRLRDGEIERFVNMCRYKEIPLWNVYWDTKRKHLYADISLKNFWRLRSDCSENTCSTHCCKASRRPFFAE